MKVLFNMYNDFPINGVEFIDLTPSLLNPQVTNEIINEMIKLYYKSIEEAKENIDMIISPDARGFIWGSMVALRLGKGFIPVRKENKLPNDAIIDTYNYQTEYSTTKLCLPQTSIEGKKLLFVDDVYATGGTYEAVKGLVRNNKGSLIGGLVVVDVELDASKEVKSLVKKSSLIRR